MTRLYCQYKKEYWINIVGGENDLNNKWTDNIGYCAHFSEKWHLNWIIEDLINSFDLKY